MGASPSHTDLRGKALEVGCGRGSLSSYFAEKGWDCTLLDSSRSVLETARNIFSVNGHRAEFVQGDANALLFPDGIFDVVFSVGLLEHFENPRQPIAEQVRVLKPGGWFFGYVVPERRENIQKYFRALNAILAGIAKVSGNYRRKPPKEEIYRSDHRSDYYLACMKGIEFTNMVTFGMYSLPMISHSPQFPFSLLPPPVERVLAGIFRATLSLRRARSGRHGWICSERMGQAFLIACQKPVGAAF